MRFLFSLAALSLPLLDIASLIAVGGRIGVWPTVAAVVLSGIAGGILVRTQGFTIIQQARTTLQSGRFPAREVFDGACVLIGGGLLMFPGFLSDALGLLLLTPPVRGLLRRATGDAARRSGRFEVFVAGSDTPRPVPGAGPVIDGEYRPVEDDADPPLVSSPVRGDDGDPQPQSSPCQRPRPATVVPPDDP